MNWNCVLPENQYGCASRLSEHAINAGLLVFAFDSLVLLIVSIVLQFVFRIPVWQFILGGLRFLTSFRIVHKDRLTGLEDEGDDSAATSPFTPERERPQWFVSASGRPLDGRIVIPSRFIGNRQVFDVPIYVTNTSQRESPQFSVTLHLRLGFTSFERAAVGAVALHGRVRSELSTELGEFWEALTFFVPAPERAGVTAQIALVTLSPLINGPVELDILWRIQYGRHNWYPDNRYGTMPLTLDAAPVRPSPPPALLPEQPPGDYEGN